MGAYYNEIWPAHEIWRHAASKRQTLILGPHYRYVLRDECIMSIVFGYHAPLLEKILDYSLPCEQESVMDLFTNRFTIKVRNGNLVISN